MPWNPPPGSVLGVFAKRPDPGAVKTRLAPLLGERGAAELHEALLRDVLELWANPDLVEPALRRVVVFDPPDAGPWFDRVAPESFALQPQAPGDLGDRMREFVDGEFESGASAVVILGVDTPFQEPPAVVSAFLALASRDVVLAPAVDGGYTLLGLRKPVPEIFEGVEWGAPRVLAQTLARLDVAGASLGVLPASFDLDTPDDLRVAASILRAHERAGIPVPPGRKRLAALCETLAPVLNPR